MEVISDDGEGSTVEEGITSITINEGEAVLVLRPDMTYRLIVPHLDLDKSVPAHTLALTAAALLLNNDPEWVEETTERIFGDVDELDIELSSLGPSTEGSA